MVERQEIYCHDCGHYVQFDIDLNMNGNHVLRCPICGHEHCRVVKNGEITDDRWDSRNGITITVSTSTMTTSTASTWTSYTSGTTTGSTILYTSWTSASTR
jgi:hypothetical protein